MFAASSSCRAYTECKASKSLTDCQIFMEKKTIQYDDDCEWAFGLNRLMLTLLGIWPNEQETRVKSLRVPFMLLWILFGFFLPQMYALVKVSSNLTLIIDNVIASCPCFLALAKLLLIWRNKQVFEPLIHWMTADWTRDKTTWKRDLMLKQAQRGRLFTMSGFAIMVSSIACFVFCPLLGIYIRNVNNITDLDERRYFPLQTYYPYDFVKSPNFELTYVAMLIAIVFAGMSLSAADNFFGVLVFHAAAQCEILAVELAKLFDTAKPDECVGFKRKLRLMVRRHVYLIRFVVVIEESFSILILAHTLCLSISNCCVGFGVMHFFADENSKPPIIQIAMLVMLLLNVMLHMLVYCAASEILTSNSERFIQAIYDSDWFRYPAKYSRDVIPMMMRSQYPLRLTIGKFFDLSLNTYAKILKASGGFISMLLAVS